MNKNNTFLLGTGLLILAQMMVGVNIVTSKYLLSTFPVLFLLMIRFILAAVILFPLHWLTQARERSVRFYFSALSQKDWIFIFAQALFAGVLFNILMLLGLDRTDANVAGIITSALPSIIALMSWFTLGEIISGKKIVSVLFATIGLAVIACDKWQGIGESHSFLGDALVLLSLLPEAAYYVLCKINPNKLPVFLISALMNAINAIILIAAFMFMPSTPVEIAGFNGFILFILGLSSGLFYVFWFLGCQQVDGIMASLSTAIMPVGTVILAWLFLGESLTLWQLSGMALIISSIFIYARR